MATVKDDELLKAACHGLLFGCALPVLAYNMARKNHGNALIYLALLGFEVIHITNHLRAAEENNELS